MFEFVVNISNLIIIASVFIGTTFGLLLILTKRLNRKANTMLGLLSFVIVLWNIWVLSVDFQVFASYPRFCLIPLNFSLALGPCMYLYTKKLTDSSFPLSVKNLLHFAPILLELIVHYLVANEAIKTSIRPVNTSAFATYIPFIQLLTISSIIVYSLKALRAIQNYHQWVRENYSNEQDYQLRWLYRLIIIFGVFWLMLVPYTAVDYFFFDFQLTIADYYPIYILMSVMTIWIGAEAFLKPEVIFLEALQKVEVEESVLDKDAILQAQWLKNEMERNQYFLDPELSLKKLGKELDLHPNHLSRLINLGIGKSFTDFINDYRVQAVISRLNDPKYDHITLLGISFECGFNSKTTFNRVFKHSTGKTPFQYKKMSAEM